MNYEDKLDTIIREALQGDETPSESFTKKIMDQVAHTPQKRAVPRKKIFVSIAACAAALVVALPILRLITTPMGSASDCAEAESAMDSTAEEDQRFTITADSAAGEDFAAPAEAENGAIKEFDGDQKLKSAAPVVVLTDSDLCADLRTWFLENGFPAKTDEEQIEFALTAEQITALKQAFPAVVLPGGACTIRLEG